MVSIREVYDQVSGINSNLEAVQTKLTEINGTLNTGFSDNNSNIQQLNANLISLINLHNTLSELQVYMNQALYQISHENYTIICYLEKISRQTCFLLNESHEQTELQKSIEKSSATLLELYKSTNAEAFLDYERLEKLRNQILDCCPEERPDPICRDEPCSAPSPLNEPEKPQEPEGPY